ncbi:MAG TPA: hypothetical protein VFA20_26520, partial [Myxococcaceae bacterium]|nr:hypothetical protein [Myxococcaceae bacterium]
SALAATSPLSTTSPLPSASALPAAPLLRGHLSHHLLEELEELCEPAALPPRWGLLGGQHHRRSGRSGLEDIALGDAGLNARCLLRWRLQSCQGLLQSRDDLVEVLPIDRSDTHEESPPVRSGYFAHLVVQCGYQ